MNEIKSLLSVEKNSPGFDACTGCGVCKLPCPVWQRTHDTALTFYGRVQAIQGGATAGDLSKSIMACLLCGACQPSCPMGMDTVQLTVRLRAMLADSNVSPLARHFESTGKPIGNSTPEPAGKGPGFFLPGRAMRNDGPLLERTLTLLEQKGPISMAGDDGSHIAESIEAGLHPSKEVLSEFIKGFEGAEKIIAGEGLMYRFLRAWKPGVSIRCVGEMLIDFEKIEKALKPADLYLIDARVFNSDYSRLVTVYDGLRMKTGCRMNMDLQRIAIPTGASSLQNRYNMTAVEPADQVRWILDGLEIERIVAESVDDLKIFRDVTEYPVIHISELG